MKEQHSLLAGAGRAALGLDGILPLEGFTRVNDPLHVRALVLETDRRIVLVSVEVTSLPEPISAAWRQRIAQRAGTDIENVWLTLTHSFAGPHIATAPQPGEPPRPHAPTPEQLAEGERLRRAYESALDDALDDALAALRPAKLAAARGRCGLAASRDLASARGWLLGTDDDEPVDSALTVLRVDTAEGKPLAAAIVYGLRSAVMHRCRMVDGAEAISADLCGAACVSLERALGEGAVALFLCGAAADQEPRLKGRDTVLDAEGEPHEERLPAEEADVLRRVQGDRLAQSALKLRRAAADLTDTPVLAAAERSFVWPGKKADPAVIPGAARVTGFQPDGERAQTIYALRLGALELIGVQPEFDAAASLSVSAQAGPERLRAAVCMVNGCGKCMPSLRAYDTCRFQADHSPFMPGAAERMVEVAGGLEL